MYTTEYTTPICKAVDAGDNEMVKVLLRGNADVLPPMRDYTPLHRAVRHGFFAIVQTLLEDKGGVQCKDQLLARFSNNDSSYGGYTALHFAVSGSTRDEENSPASSRFRTVETLLRYGADLQEPDMDGFLPLHTVERNICYTDASIQQMNMQIGKMGGHRGVQRMQENLLEMQKEVETLYALKELLLR